LKAGVVIDLDTYRMQKGMRLSFGQAMAACRNMRGLTQEELVNLIELEIDRSVISKQENGKLKVSPESAVATAKALKVPKLAGCYCTECAVKQYLDSLEPDFVA